MDKEYFDNIDSEIEAYSSAIDTYKNFCVYRNNDDIMNNPNFPRDYNIEARKKLIKNIKSRLIRFCREIGVNFKIAENYEFEVAIEMLEERIEALKIVSKLREKYQFLTKEDIESLKQKIIDEHPNFSSRKVEKIALKYAEQEREARSQEFDNEMYGMYKNSGRSATQNASEESKEAKPTRFNLARRIINNPNAVFYASIPVIGALAVGGVLAIGGGLPILGVAAGIGAFAVYKTAYNNLIHPMFHVDYVPHKSRKQRKEEKKAEKAKKKEEKMQSLRKERRIEMGFDPAPEMEEEPVVDQRRTKKDRIKDKAKRNDMRSFLKDLQSSDFRMHRTEVGRKRREQRVEPRPEEPVFSPRVEQPVREEPTREEPQVQEDYYSDYADELDSKPYYGPMKTNSKALDEEIAQRCINLITRIDKCENNPDMIEQIVICLYRLRDYAETGYGITKNPDLKMDFEGWYHHALDELKKFEQEDTEEKGRTM